ncbi:unnamed protein product [Durusdinium trenchii]|uniref:Uncharacterized protein n=1 Tax=Durusdinium trenchii TaxID=1381693 RepID=A0ABP0HVG1_9DINO
MLRHSPGRALNVRRCHSHTAHGARAGRHRGAESPRDWRACKDQEEAEECQNVEKTPGLVADQECFGTAREEHSTSEDAILTLHTVHEQEDTEEQVPQEIDEHAKDQQEAEECQNVEKTPGFAAGQESFGTAPEDHYFMSEDANNLKLDEVREQDDMTEQETEERGDKEDDESQRSMSHDASFTDRGVDTKQDVQGQGKGNEELVGKGAEEALPADEIHFTSSGATMDGENVVEQVEEARPSAHGPFEPFSIKLQEARLDAAMHPECAYQKGRLYEQAQQLFPTKSPGGLAKKSPTTNRAAQRAQREQATAVPTRGSSEVISSKHPRSKISIAATPAPAPKPQPKARPADEQAKQAQAAARKRIAAHRKTLADADKTADPSSTVPKGRKAGAVVPRAPRGSTGGKDLTGDFRTMPAAAWERLYAGFQTVPKQSQDLACDFRLMPDAAWQHIYCRFETMPIDSAQDLTGDFRTMPAAAWERLYAGFQTVPKQDLACDFRLMPDAAWQHIYRRFETMPIDSAQDSNSLQLDSCTAQEVTVAETATTVPRFEDHTLTTGEDKRVDLAKPWHIMVRVALVALPAAFTILPELAWQLGPPVEDFA